MKNKLIRVEIAKKLGVSHTAVYKWYSGKSQPTGENLVRLAKLIDRTPEATLKFLNARANRLGGVQ